MLTITIMILIANIEEAYDPIRVDFDTVGVEFDEFKEGSEEGKKKTLLLWREEYSHPLLINSSNQTTAVFNEEIKDLQEM